MAQRSAPGACADCGNDAYIRMAGENGETVMVCAHCFADHPRVDAPPENEGHQAPERTELDHRISR